MESKLSKGRTSLVAEELRLLSLPLQRVWAPSLVGGTKIPHTAWCGQNFQEKLSKGRNNFIRGLSNSDRLTSSLEFFRSQQGQNLLVFMLKVVSWNVRSSLEFSL